MALIVKNAVRDAAKGVNVSGNFYNELDSEVKKLVKKAVKRAKANGRKTVKARDL